MRKHLRQADAVYTFSGDSAWLGLIASIGLKKKVHILEVGDVRHLQTRAGAVGKVYRLIDRILTSRVQLLVVTAEGFLDQYYRKWLGTKTPGIVIENKVERTFFDSIAQPSTISPKNERPITIGYFGLMQSPWSWRVLKKIAKDNPDTFAVVLAGYPIRFDDIEEVCEQYKNISYTGTYQSPEDLEKLYTSVDLAWGCYSPFGNNDWNLMWARPNRFYEACAFHTPLISRKESTDGKYVSKLDIGYAVSETDDDTAAQNISRITRSDIEAWRKNMQALDKSMYCYTNESSLLVEKINEFVAGGPTTRDP
ncbi:MAG: hypothetical protein AB8B63_15350 [Granulosicoccus sp.]